MSFSCERKMTFYTTSTPSRQHDTHEEAERAIEIYYTRTDLIYEVVPVCYRRCGPEITRFAVKAYLAEGAFAGYCYDTDEVAACRS